MTSKLRTLQVRTMGTPEGEVVTSAWLALIAAASEPRRSSEGEDRRRRAEHHDWGRRRAAGCCRWRKYWPERGLHPSTATRPPWPFAGRLGLKFSCSLPPLWPSAAPWFTLPVHFLRPDRIHPLINSAAVAIIHHPGQMTIATSLHNY